MAVERNLRPDRPLPVPQADGRGHRDPEPSMADLVRQLAADSSALVRQEVALAKLEVREYASHAARQSAAVGAGVGMAAAGGLALTAFLVIGLGVLLGGLYWLSALIVGVMFLAAGYVLVRRGIQQLTAESPLPEETIETLREDADWAKRETREMKRGLTS
jgi:uncharacterized membrane protein YqjE